MEYAPIDLNEVAMRPLRYWDSDGLPDIVLGGVWLIWALCLVPLPFIPSGPWAVLYGFAIPVALLASAFWGHWYLVRLKTRVTAARSGYIHYRPRVVGALYLSTALASGAAVAIARRILTGPIPEDTTELTPSLAGLVLTAVFTAQAVKRRMPHHLWQAAAAAIVSVSLIRWPADLRAGMVTLFASVGLVSLLLGGARLRSFLSRNPVSQGGAE
jgi:hypothetical protein